MPKIGESERARKERMKQEAEFRPSQRRALLGDQKKPASAPKPRSAEREMVKKGLLEILKDRDEDIMDVVDEAVTGAKGANPDY